MLQLRIACKPLILGAHESIFDTLLEQFSTFREAPATQSSGTGLSAGASVLTDELPRLALVDPPQFALSLNMARGVVAVGSLRRPHFILFPEHDPL